MQFYSILASRSRARFTVGLLLILSLFASLLLLSTASQVEAQAVPAKTAQLATINMLDQMNGWALSADRLHLLATSRGPQHWTDVTPTLITGNLDNSLITTTYFPGANRAYIGLQQNDKVWLLSTQNAGKTWQSTAFDVPSITGPVTIAQVTFLDQRHGWLSFKRANFKPGEYDILLMSTKDGGKTWQTLFDTTEDRTALPLPYGLSSQFTFTDPNNGWVTGILLYGDVYLYRTRDGGKTWQNAGVKPVKGQNSIYFTLGYGPYWRNKSDGTLYVKYDTDSGNGNPHLTSYQTHDGGATWILEPSSPSTSFQEFYLFSFLNAQNAWSFGFDGRGQFLLHHTENGGQTWSTIQPKGLMKPQADNQVNMSLDFVNPTTGWVLIKDEHEQSHLFQSNTGGRTWKEIPTLLN